MFWSNEETEKESLTSKTKKAALNRQYQHLYLKYRFIATDDSHAPSLLCIICGDSLVNEAMKPSKLLLHMEITHPAVKARLWSFLKGENGNKMDRNNC